MSVWGLDAKKKSDSVAKVLPEKMRQISCLCLVKRHNIKVTKLTGVTT